MRFAVDRQSPNAKIKPRRNFGERGLRALSPGQAVGDNSDMIAMIDLSVGEIENVTKDSADRRAYGVQDPKWPVWGLGHAAQNQRSPTRMMSPGLIAVPSGTMARLALWVSVTASRLARGEKPPAIATALSTLILGA